MGRKHQQVTAGSKTPWSARQIENEADSSASLPLSLRRREGERVKNGPTREISAPDLTAATAEKTIFSFPLPLSFSLSLSPPLSAYMEFYSHNSTNGRRGGDRFSRLNCGKWECSGRARQSRYLLGQTEFKPPTMIGRRTDGRGRCLSRRLFADTFDSDRWFCLFGHQNLAAKIFGCGRRGGGWRGFEILFHAPSTINLARKSKLARPGCVITT